MVDFWVAVSDTYPKLNESVSLIEELSMAFVFCVGIIVPLVIELIDSSPTLNSNYDTATTKTK